MKVAVAGVGNFSSYLLEEIPKEGHELVVLTRSHKPRIEELGIEQRITDYTRETLTAALADVDAVVCTVPPTLGRDFVTTHLALLDAARQPGVHCKRIIPSFWGGNHEDVPDQPIHAAGLTNEVVNALRRQSEVGWALVSNGWLADYVLPDSQRHMPSIGPIWPQDHASKVFTLYGLGTTRVSFTAARDAARATARLFTVAERGVEWDHFVYVEGESTTWRGLYELLKGRDPAYTIQKKSLAQSIAQLTDPKTDEFGVVLAEFEIMGHSEGLEMPAAKVAEHREKYFGGLKFRTLAELMGEAAANLQSVM